MNRAAGDGSLIIGAESQLVAEFFYPGPKTKKMVLSKVKKISVQDIYKNRLFEVLIEPSFFFFFSEKLDWWLGIV